MTQPDFEQFRNYRSEKMDQSIKNSLLRESQRKTTISICILLFLGLLSTVMSVYLYFGTEQYGPAVFQLFLAASFVFFATYTRQNAYRANFLALAFYLLLTLMMALSEPVSFIEGLILKAVVIGVLIRGVKAGREIRNIEKRLLPSR